MRDLKIKEVQVVQNVNGTEKIPVSNGSGQPAVITVNQILDKVDNKISEVIDGAPETLDTLKEIAEKVLSLNEFESLSDNNVITGTFTTETENLEVLVTNDPTIFSKMVIDGKEVPILKSGLQKVIIPSVGKHTIKYYLIDNPKYLSAMFRNCCLETADLSKLDKDLGNLNWSSMFEGSKISNVNFANLEHFHLNGGGNNSSLFINANSEILTISNLKVSLANTNWFDGCTAHTIVLDNVNFLHCTNNDFCAMFARCPNLTKIVMNCPIKKGMHGLYGMFTETTTIGTFYYNGLYDYSGIIKYLPEGWTAIDLTTMSNYVTEDELTAKGYLTEHQSLADYALKSELPDTSNLATKDEIPTDYLTTIPEATTDTLGGVKKITVDTLADGADIATVVAAYNNLVNKLIESGLAATLLDA